MPWPLTHLLPVQMWLGRAMASTDFFYFITSFAFMTTRMGFTMAMVPSGMAALLDLLAAGQQQLGHLALWQRTGARAHAWVTSRPVRGLERCREGCAGKGRGTSSWAMCSGAAGVC